MALLRLRVHGMSRSEARKHGSSSPRKASKETNADEKADDESVSERYQESPTYQAFMTRRALLLSVALLSVLSFCLGRLCRPLALDGLWETYPNLYGMAPPLGSEQRRASAEKKLPYTVLSKGENIPETSYTSKHFDGPLPAPDAGHQQWSVELSSHGEIMLTSDDGDDNKNDGQQNPRGYHLLVDIENVDDAFLDSQERLAAAMTALVDDSGLAMLSYHCHSLDPGVSCVGFLPGGHVSFHTWPEHGVVTIDLCSFRPAPRPLAPLLGRVERLFGVPPKDIASTVEPKLARSTWLFKERGFGQDGSQMNPEAVGFGHFLLGWMEFDLKEEVVSVETDFQTIDIYDVVNPRFHVGESFAKPDRIVFLDHIMQSRRYGDSAYHESLVHPAMFAHDMPRRVAIIGGGEGATLREVLKHKTVEKVVMVEIDKAMVDISRKYLPEWSDCSNFAARTSSCFEDPRAEVYYEDAVGWFIERFGKGSKHDPSELFDVIIMDAL